MSDNELPSPEMLRQLLRYEPETGRLFWLPRPTEMFESERVAKMWTTRFSHKQAFSAVGKRGYCYGMLGRRTCTAHRVIWAMQAGAWPAASIDHINKDRVDNRWCNLREASHAENVRNSKSREGSSSPYLGVSWDAKSLKWRARIQFNKKQMSLGIFDCPAAAAREYDLKAKAYFGHFASLNFPPLDVNCEA